ncbi:MAG TPA: DUF5947 family protein [Acidimicrobiales bacterium]
MSDDSSDAGPLGILERIRRPPAPVRAGERCELCGVDIPDDHSHVADVEDRGLRCACRPCALLFTRPGAAGGRFRTVPDRYLAVTDLELSPGQWDALQIPVAMAFFFRSSRSGEVAGFYPSPAGATECLLPLEAWAEIEDANPVVTTIEPDVEAVLLRATPPGFECFVVPIDACYELVGHLRRLWRGFDGGREAHDRMTAFLDGIRSRARTVGRG